MNSASLVHTADEIEVNLIERVQESYREHPGYEHWFWEWFATSELSRSQIEAFAHMYYQHVLRFRLYVAAAITVAPIEGLQVALSEILADEYGVPLASHPAADSHPEMFRKFMRSLGMKPEESEGAKPIKGIQYFFDFHFSLFRGGLTSEALGALIFGMESTTPYRHGCVLQGLEAFEERANVTLDKTFFSSHVEVDEHHSNLLYETAMPVMRDNPLGIMRGASYSFDARKVFLDDLGWKVQAVG